MTNIAVIATIMLSTNNYLHPSGEWYTNVVSVRVIAPIEYEGRSFVLSATNGLLTNVYRMTWTPVAAKLARNPLAMKDEIPTNIYPPGVAIPK